MVASLLGAPVFVALGGLALVLFWAQGTPIAAVALDHYSLVVNPTLPMIPLFTAAGFFLAESGAPQRIIRVFHALFGRLRAGAAVVTVLVCTFFTSFTGASGVTILALGGLLMPLLLSAGHSSKSALGLVTGGGSPGVLLIPALPLILYAIVASADIKTMFLGALLPACLMFVLTAGWGARQGAGSRRDRHAFDWPKARSAIADAKWELLLPVVPVGAISSGLATPVEAAALTACYAGAVETLVHRDLKLASDIPRILAENGLLVGGILLILGVALGFTNYLVDAQIPDRALDWVTGSMESR
jgi:tripartite ATP-independent transporter DctM subunit